MDEIFSKIFDNGIEIRINDRSRNVAADRWLVRIEVVIGLDADCLDALRGQFSGADPRSWRELEKGPLMVLARERNFIDRQETDAVRDRIVDGIRADIINYLADSAFPARLVARRLEEIERQRSRRHAVLSEVDDDDDEPADFSHLFK